MAIFAQFFKPDEPENPKYVNPNPKVVPNRKPVQPEPETFGLTSTRTRRILNPIHHYCSVAPQFHAVTKL